MCLTRTAPHPKFRHLYLSPSPN